MIKNLLIKVFKFSCILSTIIMVGFWIYKYQLNEDSTTIEYKLVNEINDIVHPEFSIGILEPFLNDELQKKLNVSSDDTLDDQYKEFLRGNETYFEKFKDVEYEKVTPNLFKYLEKIDFFWKTGSSHTQLSCTDMQNCSLVKLRNNYNGFIEWHFMKAYGLQINPTNAKDVTQIEFSFNSDLENVISQVEGVFVTFNYPNQYLRSLEGSTLIWNHSGNESNQDIFEVTSFEILRRRNKKMEPCLSQWKLYDELILESHMKKMMCRAPYQKPCNNLKPCNTAFDIKRSIYNGFFDRGKAFDRPCQEMPTITYKHLFHYKPIPENQTKKFRFFLQYPRRGKVITQSKAIDGQTLIGNIGGYIGLLLGYAIIQLPEMMSSFHGFVKHGGLHRYLFGSNTKRIKENKVHPLGKVYREKFEKKHGILAKNTGKRMVDRNRKRSELEKEICNMKLKINEIESKFSSDHNR